MQKAQEEKKKMSTTHRKSLLQAKVQQAIKRQQIRKFINAGQRSSEIGSIVNNENNQLFDHLLGLKASCSAVIAQLKQKQIQQNKLKDRTNLITQKVKALQFQKQKLEQQANKSKTMLQEVKAKRLNSQLGLKSYQHILDRLQKDDLRFQIKRNQLQSQLKVQQKLYKQLNNKAIQLKQLQFLSLNGLREAQGQVVDLKQQRKQAINNISRVIDQNSYQEIKKKEREQKNMQIKQMAAGDLDDIDLVRVKNFLFSQKFLKIILTQKIQKMKKFYEPYEMAFLKIKGNTMIRDSNCLVQHYHAFENNYQQKSIWISQLQKNNSNLQQQKKKCQEQLTRVKDIQIQLLEQLQCQKKSNDENQLSQLKKKSTKFDVMMTQIKQWIKCQAYIMQIDKNKKSDEQIFEQIIQCLKIKINK